MALSLITPSNITAGDTAEWLIASSLYPAPEWTLSYVLVKSGQQITFTSSQYGSTTTHHISNLSSTTADWAPGVYSFRSYVTDGTHRHPVESGSIEILADFVSATIGLDDRSFSKRCLDNIESVIEGRATQAQLEYAIAGRQLRFIPPADLMNLRDRFRAEYRAEEAAKLEKRTGKSRWGQVQVRFS